METHGVTDCFRKTDCLQNRGEITYICAMRYIPYLLLSLIFLQSFGYLAVFDLQRYQIRKDIKHRIKNGVPEGELILFKMPTDPEKRQDFRFVEAHEFRYKGGMYDVVRQENHGEQIWYYCVSDEMEAQLFANLETLVADEIEGNTERKKRNKRLQNLLTVWYLQHSNQDGLALSVDGKAPGNHVFGLKTWMLVPATPPPKSDATRLI